YPRPTQRRAPPRRGAPCPFAAARLLEGESRDTSCPETPCPETRRSLERRRRSFGSPSCVCLRRCVLGPPAKQDACREVGMPLGHIACSTVTPSPASTTRGRSIRCTDPAA